MKQNRNKMEQTIVWEVNFWAWSELNTKWKPTTIWLN